MPLKTAAERKAYGAAYYQKHKVEARSKQKSQREHIRRLVQEHKERAGCMDCKQMHPYYVLDFDHRDGMTKVDGVCGLVKSGCSLEVVMKEVQKCDVVCANCHRIRTHQRQFAGLG
jgi:copper oxidase (laccase) domain-containing protein